jgi:hypothetical protein
MNDGDIVASISLDLEREYLGAYSICASCRRACGVLNEDGRCMDCGPDPDTVAARAVESLARVQQRIREGDSRVW